MSQPDHPDEATYSHRVLTRRMAALLEQEKLKDPLELSGADVFHIVLQHVAPGELVTASLVCRAWRAAAEDTRLWAKHSQALWQGKAYVPRGIRDSPPQQAYSQALQDCTRAAITKDELCSFAWHFSFKDMWMDFPQELPDMLRYFHHDSTFTTGPGDPWSGTEYKWQFRSRSEGRRGVFVQVHTFPPLTISRRPDWGWHMENMFVELASGPVAPRTCACCPAGGGEE